MFCQNCGNELKNENTNFCPSCGYHISNVKIKVRTKKNFNVKKCILPLCVLAGIILIGVSIKVIASNVSLDEKIDITHGGEKVWTAASNEEEWLFDYNWAEIDEDWDGFEENASLKLGFDLLTGSSDLLGDIVNEIDRDYIEERLRPVHYDKDSYFEFCPALTVKHAENAWKKYLKDHKELKNMYIVVNGEKYFPYADDDFDKNVFINEYTMFDVSFDTGVFFDDEYTAKQFYIKLFKAESLWDVKDAFEWYGFNDCYNQMDEVLYSGHDNGFSSTHYFYPEDDYDFEYGTQAQMNFLEMYFPDGVYQGEDGSVYASYNSDYGAYALTININNLY